MPINEEMKRAYQLIESIRTPHGTYINQVLEVGDDYIDLISDKSGSGHRRITFDDIRNNAGTHWQIIQSLRQIIDLSNEA
jgi:hypothetical protein